jgi:hypothetical protein
MKIIQVFSFFSSFFSFLSCGEAKDSVEADELVLRAVDIARRCLSVCSCVCVYVLVCLCRPAIFLCVCLLLHAQGLTTVPVRTSHRSWASHLPVLVASIGPYGAFLANGDEYRGNYGLVRLCSYSC